MIALFAIIVLAIIIAGVITSDAVLHAEGRAINTTKLWPRFAVIAILLLLALLRWLCKM